jgi:septal ring factor EnvC (AmiA/AmiB activator)
MEDVLRRLGSLEKDVSLIKTEIAGITAVLPTFATKADVAQLSYMAANMATKGDVKAEVAGVRTEIAEVRTEIAEVRTEIAGVRTEIADVRTEVAAGKASHIQWTVGTMIALTALAFTIAKFVH